MKSIVLYIVLLIAGAVGFFLADKIFDFRSDYYRSKYEKQIKEIDIKYQTAEAQKAILNTTISELSGKIEAKDMEIEIANQALEQKKASYKILASQRSKIDDKFQKIMENNVGLDTYNKCLSIKAMRESLGYECGDYCQCEKFK